MTQLSQNKPKTQQTGSISAQHHMVTSAETGENALLAADAGPDQVWFVVGFFVGFFVGTLGLWLGSRLGFELGSSWH